MSNIKETLKKFWKFLKSDSWGSLFVWLIIIFIFLRLIFFPTLSFITQAPLPIVIVESCSMYHDSNFDSWWNKNSVWYEANGIEKHEFANFSLKGGLNKGDIVFVWGRSSYELGDIIVFAPNKEAETTNPIIHRIVSVNPEIDTKGDNNAFQFNRNNNGNRLDETGIAEHRLMGKAVAKIPLVGWVKLIFFEFSRPESQKGLCN